MPALRYISLVTMLALLGGCHDYGFLVKRESECNCPTDIRQMVPWCAGEDAVFSCPCGPNSEFFGHKPTCWGVWPTSGAQWRDAHCGTLQTVQPVGPQVSIEPYVVVPPAPPTDPIMPALPEGEADAGDASAEPGGQSEGLQPGESSLPPGLEKLLPPEQENPSFDAAPRYDSVPSLDQADPQGATSPIWPNGSSPSGVSTHPADRYAVFPPTAPAFADKLFREPAEQWVVAASTPLSVETPPSASRDSSVRRDVKPSQPRPLACSEPCSEQAPAALRFEKVLQAACGSMTSLLPHGVRRSQQPSPQVCDAPDDPVQLALKQAGESTLEVRSAAISTQAVEAQGEVHNGAPVPADVSNVRTSERSQPRVTTPQPRSLLFIR